MRKIFIVSIMCLSSSIAYATDPSRYFLLTGGKGSGFSMKTGERPVFVYSQQKFFGASIQMPFRWNTLFDGALLVSPKAKEIPTDYSSITNISPTGSTELALKKPFAKVSIAQSASLKFYAKGGVWLAFAQANYLGASAPLANGGGLIGGGFQSKLSSHGLIDVSFNWLPAVRSGGNNVWNARVGIGPRF